MPMKKNLFITGNPGCGKTTLIKEVCLPFIDKVGGFYTEEMIDNNSRLGFLLKTFDGREGILAKKGMKSAHRFNKYGINIGVLEGIAADSLKKTINDKELIVIDEIGSMEIISEKFRKALMEALNSEKRVLATLRYNAQPFTDDIKKMKNSSIITLSRENYIDVKKEVKKWIGEL
jgi:nucleoside-triphosphatase